MKIRLIIQSTENFEQEYMDFSDDFEADVKDFKYSDCSIDFDKVIEMDEVSCFPVNYSFKRVD